MQLLPAESSIAPNTPSPMTIGSKNKSACYQVLHTPELLDAITSNLPFDYKLLRQVNRTFRDSVDQPKRWKLRFHPAEILWSEHRIYSAVNPENTWPSQWQHLRRQDEFPLGTFQKKRWTLKLGQQVRIGAVARGIQSF